MPELPEVETVMRGLTPAMKGAILARLDLHRPNLRYPFPAGMAKTLEGHKISGLSRRAKYLMIHFDNGMTLVGHLGMSGSYRVEDDTVGRFHHARSKNTTHDHVVFHLERPGGQHLRVIYNDPRRFGYMFMDATSKVPENPHLAGLGMEPTGNTLSGASLAPLFENKTTPLKSALLDQRLIAGLGNIYVCEALWRTGLSPKRKAGTLVNKSGRPTKKCDALAEHVREVIADAINAGGSSLRDHAQTDGTLGYFQHSFQAYGREDAPCRKPDCDGTIKRISQSGRSTFYCTTCQR